MRKRQGIILFDVDGVYVDFNREFMDRLNEKYDTLYHFHMITDFPYSFLPKEHRDYMIEVLWEARDLYDYAVPDKGMEDVVESLRKEHRVIGCSSPLLGHVRSKLEFMWDHFGKGNTILTASKDLVVGDVLVDDGPHNIESFPGPVVVYDRPWNQELDRTHDLARATTPGGLLYHITEVLEYTSRAY